MKTMMVEVTAEDIRLGRPRNHCYCPIARAVTRALGLSLRTAAKARAVGVSDRTARFHMNGHECRAILPRSATRFVRVFDGEGGRRLARPFRFRLGWSDT